MTGLTNSVPSILSTTFLQIWLGAICAHMLSLNSPELTGTVQFMKRFLPSKSDTFYFRFDFVVLPLIGALLADVLLDPASLKASIFAGISWSGTLMAFLKTQKNNNN